MGHQYVSRLKGGNIPHNTSAEEIRALFIKAGWIGEYRVPHRFLKAVPFFDTGPGPDLGR